ncbi:unnamed protein product [Kuraishia capsulata CBS 1993]|uniref:UBC core domain-containing protein n=1 Tax=Kuraishia capsulata CBS 1993 TaxID=1382522 RepID=W6MM68_9ASCO|nr:uncharacterized protein KUCA_T00003595001 [Kuraishia capsulata CBS 1993]CDK27616.1 unnamed protein product [Kuraishia capsulata CBS 1993]
MASSAARVLHREFRELTDPRKGIPSFHIELDNDNIFLWNVGVMVLNKDSVYNGAYLKAQMKFPSDYPFSPPSFRFTPAIYHPNVYRDGRLCISILHTSGNEASDEPDNETWSPAQSSRSVLISIVSLLEDPNISSPANVDAALDYRKNPEEYKRKVQTEVARSKQDIPRDFTMPTTDDAYGQAVAEDYLSDSDDFFGGEDSYDEDDVSFGEDDDVEMSEDEEDEHDGK